MVRALVYLLAQYVCAGIDHSFDSVVHLPLILSFV